MINWFVIHNSEHLGPFSEEVLHQLFSEGDIEQKTLIWKEGMDESISYEEAFLFKKEELSFKPIEETIEQKINIDTTKTIGLPWVENVTIRLDKAYFFNL